MSEGAEDRIRALTEQLQRLQADNVRLRQQAVAQQNLGEGQGGANSRDDSLADSRYVFLPRERKCPRFAGNAGAGCLGEEEWVEEARKCLNSKFMTLKEQALFLYDHLEGEAKSKIRFRSAVDRDNPE